ncbi:ubiquinone biosynthesis regulatory protein kinase UbiB [Ferrimonas marina]|uniref:2-octaprenylphenol hydroxylase n=1 Tax=Ferrimonas marina TaxID=299255 RepID=A0A1M5XXN6_9GAMM|nr:ubiquinone biosynthesis regulatory protein kinase UbiB [Ferrimonas marina]SHI04502.1 2-octaprenylphenol hydroxylase [Ferrimonas marina]
MSWRALRRGFTILKVLRQYQLIDLLPAERQPTLLRLLDRALVCFPRQQAQAPVAQRLKLALQSLGPVFIKFGQMLSTRRDLLPDELADALALLQDQVPPFDSQLAIERIEAALGHPIEEAFDDFDATPLASASVAQIHTARLKSDGQAVVLKVIRPGIEQTIRSDLSLMEWGAKLVASSRHGQRLHAPEVVADYRRTILAELDLVREADNARQLRVNFEGSDALYVPEVFPQFNHRDLMVMERIDGIPVTDIPALKAQGTNMKRLAERGVEVFFTQVFRDNFFHADMHPGNIFVAREHPEDPYYIGIDCGIVGRLSEQDKRDMAAIFLAFFNHDYRQLAQIFLSTGWVDASADLAEFEFALRQVFQPLENKPLSEISFGHVLVSLFRTAHEFGMVVKPQLVLLEKTLLYIEGLGRQLYPELDLWATAKPFLEQWMTEQHSPQAQLKRWKEVAPRLSEQLPELPELLHENLILGRNLLANPGQVLNRYILERRRQHTSSLFLWGGGVLVISSTILLGKTVTIWPSATLFCLGILAWLVSWQIRKP